MLAVYATALDSMAAEYFHDTIRNCDFPDESECFCEGTKHEYEETFRLRDSDCSNAFTRNPDYLIANAVLTGLCALLLCIYVVAFLWKPIARYVGGYPVGDELTQV